MKRSFHQGEIDSLSMANCLMLLSQGRDQMVSFPFEAIKSTNIDSSSRVFECKTCNRQFPSFQALGGHRASHKKPKLMNGDIGSLEAQSSPAKPKTHECSICGLEFAIGQALGGHMRRHRAAMNNNNNDSSSTTTTTTTTYSSPTSSAELVVKPAAAVPVLKKSNSNKRVLCLDLNLSPYENDIELFSLGKTAPMVDCLL